MARFREMDDGFCQAKSLIGFALAAHEADAHEQARALGDQGLGLLREVGAKGELAARLNQLGGAALAHGDLARAAALTQESLTLYAETPDTPGIATSLETLARVSAEHGRAPAVLRLLAAADALRRAQGLEGSAADREACDRAIGVARAQLDVETAAAAWSDGAAMTLEQAITYARAETMDVPPQ